MKELEGVVPAILTPFTSDGSVDLHTLRKLVRYLAAAGAGGFYVNGSTGEWVSLSLEERKQVASTVVREASGRIPVVIHVGHFSTACAVELGRHAASIGADYLASVTPTYYPYTTKEVEQYFRALAAIGLPVIAYSLKSKDAALGPRAFMETIGSIPGVVGLKYTGEDLFAMQRILQLSGGELRVWSGVDQMALPGLLMGARGVIGSNYNYLPELYGELYGAFRAGDLAGAARLQQEANRILFAVKHFGFYPAYRAALRLRGLDIGDCRPPFLPLGAAETAALCHAIEPFAHRFGKIDGQVLADGGAA